MIGRLRGFVDAESPDGELVVDVNGVGYEIRMPLGSLGRVPTESDGARTIHVHTAYKQDGVELYGFASVTERAIFRCLISVPNVGPKTALGILSAMPANDLAAAIDSGDAGRLSKTPGIGKKTAERLIVELKGKLGFTAGASLPTAASPSKQHPRSERLITALVNMGYRPVEAARAVESLGAQMEERTPAEALREALALLARR
jgi:Holliday junction DNA helicase RuvA